MSGIAVEFDDKGTVQRIRALSKQAKNPRAMMLAGGRGVANRLKKHFRDKNKAEPNKLGGKRENFWTKVGQSVQAPVADFSGLTVRVSINDPRFAQKLFGGVIRAKRVRNLSIPQTAEAYGRSPSTFEAETGLKLTLIKLGGTESNSFENLALAAHQSGGLQIEYLLTPRVIQEPTPGALPTEQELTDAFMGPAEAVVKRQTEGQSE